MCGRYTNRHSRQELQALYGLPDISLPQTHFKPRYNIAPTQEAPVVRLKDARREVAFLKWGLISSTAKDATGADKMINARAETVANKPLFRSSFRHRRCLVVADGFYEWKKISAKEKQPYFITLKNNAPFAFAGLYESWVPREGPRVETFIIVTCAPNALVSPLHDRMPVILQPKAWRLWLGEELASPSKLQSLLGPIPAELTTCWPVDKRVANVANEGPELIAAL